MCINLTLHIMHIAFETRNRLAQELQALVQELIENPQGQAQTQGQKHNQSVFSKEEEELVYGHR